STESNLLDRRPSRIGEIARGSVANPGAQEDRRVLSGGTGKRYVAEGIGLSPSQRRSDSRNQVQDQKNDERLRARCLGASAQIMTNRTEARQMTSCVCDCSVAQPTCACVGTVRGGVIVPSLSTVYTALGSTSWHAVFAGRGCRRL